MMKLLKVIFLLLFVSCSHHHQGTRHHHKKESLFKIDHGGKTYYFNSALEKEEFSESIKKELQNPKCERRGRALVCPDEKEK